MIKLVISYVFSKTILYFFAKFKYGTKKIYQSKRNLFAICVVSYFFEGRILVLHSQVPQ